jgi:DNA-binding CsgD family transcriptional regulator
VYLDPFEEGDERIPRKRFSVEQIINHLREAEILVAQGKTVGEICRRIGLSE